MPQHERTTAFNIPVFNQTPECFNCITRITADYENPYILPEIEFCFHGFILLFIYVRITMILQPVSKLKRNNSKIITAPNGAVANKKRNYIVKILQYMPVLF
jgi:hypothetical protein